MAEVETRALSTLSNDPEMLREDTSSAALILSGDAMDRALRFADIMATGRSTVPKHLQGNRGDCLAVTIQAMQWGMMPFAVAQKTHVVSGTLGYEAQLVNAVINARAPVTGRMNYEWFGDWDKIAGRFKEVPAKNNPDEKRIVKDWTIKDEEGLGVEVWATFKGEAEPRRLRLLLAQAGVRNSPLWGQDPKQQLAYLAVKRWSRLYCPDVILGVYTPDELEERAPRDMGKADVVAPEQPVASDDLLNQARGAADKGVGEYQKFWSSTSKENRKLLAGEHETLKKTAIAADANRTVENEPTKAQPAKAETATAATDSAAPVISADEVSANMANAVERNDMESLLAAADMIRAVADEQQRAKLSQQFADFREQLEGGAE
jgi:hypothetical protein